jgi:hypothetical protein
MSKAAKSSRLIARALAKPGDPYVTLDGRQIRPEGEDEGIVMAPKVADHSFTPTKKRSLGDLPGEPKLMNAFACVILYTVLGVSDREIAVAMGTKTDEVKRIKGLANYKECFDTAVSEFINANSNFLHARIAAHSHAALDRVIDIATNGKKEETALRASVDLLDRGGVTKKEQDKFRPTMDELRITITRGGEDVSVDLSRAM